MPLVGGGFIDRPLVAATLSYGTERLETSLLLDSGADFSLVPREFLDTMGVEVEKFPREEMSGVGDKGLVAVCDLSVTFAQQTRNFTFDAPFQCYLDRPGFPQLPLLGREPVFRLFDVRFRMSFTAELGKITLTQVTKRRDASDYKVGGKPIRPRPR